MAAPSSLAASLPAAKGPFAPSLLQPPAETSTGTAIARIDDCSRCHADTAAQWRESAHAIGSFNNPIYRTGIDRIRRDVGKTESRFCAGCHDIALMVDGQIDATIKADDPRSHAGISCLVCHGAEGASLDGNASLTLSRLSIPIPVDGDAESVRAHKQAAGRPALRKVELCGSCHRAFLDEGSGNATHLKGMDDIGQHLRSAHAGSHLARIDDVEPRTCRDCHMPREDAPLGDAAAHDGTVASHRFTGAHTWLAQMRGDRDQLAKAQKNLRGAASIDVAALVRANGERVLPAEAGTVAPGEQLTLQVVVRNLRVGHKLPGGTLDAQDVWVEVEVRDARGQRIATAGAGHARGLADPSAHVLRNAIASATGEPLLARETHLFRAVVFDHSIPPRDAAAIDYDLDVPGGISPDRLPLTVVARLRHRTRNLTLARVTCEDSRTVNGRAFLDQSARITGTRLDACAPPPITDIAETTVRLAGQVTTDRPLWKRMYEHGMALLRGVQERLDDARPSLEMALASAPGPREQAMVLVLLARLEAKEGRVDEALAWAARAEALAPAEPSIDDARGEALAQVWRWQDAVEPMRRAAAAAPLDESAQARLAVALGSAGMHAEALDVARRGLALQPRDHDMLRVQALALAALGAPDDLCRSARDTYLACRTPDDAPKLRSACSKNVPGCALERIPIHPHPLLPAP